MKRIAKYKSMLNFSLKISTNASISLTVLRILLVILVAFLPLVNAISISKIVNALIVNDLSKVLLYFALLFLAQISSVSFNKVILYIESIHNEKINICISKMVIDKISNLDISYFDNPKLYDEYVNSLRDSVTIPTMVWNFLSLLISFTRVIYSFCLVGKLGLWVPIILIISCIPNFFLDKYYSVKMYNWTRNSTNTTRKINYLFSTLTEKYFSKDVRINVLHDHLYNSYIHLWNKWFDEKKGILKKQFVTTISTVLIPYITMSMCLWLVIFYIYSEKLLIGDLTYFISMINQLVGSTFSIVSITSIIIRDSYKFENFQNFLNWKPMFIEHGKKTIKEIESIEFRNVSFSYPNTTCFILKNISFTINKGEKIAFIGKNGSGKSTIIKLILKLYIPTSGNIFVNNIELSEIDNKSYYRLVSVMFQDYINYCFTLKENFLLSCINCNPTKNDMYEACEQSDINSIISKWENGYDTYLTKSFDPDGVELSSGQWQRIALARTFVKNCNTYIYDEPSSSIDVEAESKIMSSLFYNKEKTIIMITHNLHYMECFNKIILIENGEIIEQGSHDELLNKAKKYKELHDIFTSKRSEQNND